MFHETTMKMLQFDTIQHKLAELCRTEVAKARALALCPVEEPTLLQARREETSSARKIFDVMGRAPIHSQDGMQNLAAALRSGDVLSPRQLHAVADFCRHSRLLISYAQRAQSVHPLVAGWGLSIRPLHELNEEIDRCLRGEELFDSASPQLMRIRRGIEKDNERIREKLAAALRAHPEWFQESFSSLRGGRHVLPVKRECRAQVKGAVLDASASGASVFIEPEAVRALQEQLDLARIEERNEEMRILAELTRQVAHKGADIKLNRQAMESLDFAFACGEMGASMAGVDAQSTPRRELILDKARHPLLGAGAVPLTLELGAKTRALVITGPNTGGKTVTLKTVGLLSLMALCGLQVPAEKAIVPQFSGIYADIGDGQSIEQSLSTFSSHIRRIVDILGEVNGRALVLLDELGSGTDPQEGMGIAVAVMEELGRRRCLLIATSHYPQIKVFASEQEGFLNARMLFDKVKLAPTYVMQAGEAGESSALYIARRLGLPAPVLDRAWAAAYPQGAPEQRLARDEAYEAYAQERDDDVAQAANDEAEADMPVPPPIKEAKHKQIYRAGDMVTITSMGQRGLVAKEVNARGEITVRVQGKNYVVHEKRVKLFMAGSELYPDGQAYDLDIVLRDKQFRRDRRDVDKGKKGAALTLED